MLRWLGPRKVQSAPDQSTDISEAVEEVTEDPLAAIGPKRKGQKIYSVSRINPLFEDNYHSTTLNRKNGCSVSLRNSYPPSNEKSDSSGYGGSRVEVITDTPEIEKLRLRDDLVSILEQNSNYVKSIQIGTVYGKHQKSVPSLVSGSSAGGTLTTIPEGKVDFGIPKPVWPKFSENLDDLKKQINPYDSLVDEALLLYTSKNYVPNSQQSFLSDKDVSIKEILIDLSNCINATINEKNNVNTEKMLKRMREKISTSLDVLKYSSEDEMRKLYVNLSNQEKISTVVRAFSNSSSSGNSSQGSPEFNCARIRTISGDVDEIYQVPSASSSSGFSDSVKHSAAFKYSLPTEEVALNSNGIRNAIIYGTLCRTNHKFSSANDQYLHKTDKCDERKKSLLLSSEDSKPSVWQQYYGVNLAQQGEIKYNLKPSDVPVYPGGRPEADFTLDLPRSELLAKKMKQDKKWRCRCRLLTSFLGLVFFLLSVMAVSLMLTRGKRMFGSMV
ncbi:hypothetical protein RN001_000849 [Aquatica leii]|uniref:Uncharacterized protein n=1 Tax=Aquatica leii TaxID=1421715 RepID=A0AAN7SQP2_9COLE|nr:hypothetical protein RN001_000849 [Aquatica leii]